MTENEKSFYDVPKWAGIPPPGHHLDVMKEGKLFQKLMIDEKNHYLFGRNINLTDFCIDHASCSRVHAALVYHKNLDRFFLVDLGSTHGSFIGNIRIEAHKPTQLPIDSSFHFGASTRVYVLREKPKNNNKEMTGDEDAQLSLPESEFELDHITEYNTAQNRRINMLGLSKTDDIKPATAKKRKSVQFETEDVIINPEDVDPSVGRFRNLVQTSVIVNYSKEKRLKLNPSEDDSSDSAYSRIMSGLRFPSSSTSSSSNQSKFSTRTNHLLQKNPFLGIALPNPAPEVNESFKNNEIMISETTTDSKDIDLEDDENFDNSRHSKKYAKESWPGHEKTTSLANF